MAGRQTSMVIQDPSDKLEELWARIIAVRDSL